MFSNIRLLGYIFGFCGEHGKYNKINGVQIKERWLELLNLHLTCPKDD